MFSAGGDSILHTAVASVEGPLMWLCGEGPRLWILGEGPLLWLCGEGPLLWLRGEGPLLWILGEDPLLWLPWLRLTLVYFMCADAALSSLGWTVWTVQSKKLTDLLLLYPVHHHIQIFSTF